MPSMVFINIPVRDLKASMAYYKSLGFDHNPQFTDETAACIVIDDNIFVMVLTHDKFRQFSPLPIPDAHSQVQALYALSRDSRDAVDAIAEAGLKAGGQEFRPAQDMGFMYSRAIADVDGHVWEYVWMDMSAEPPAV
jgi:predicted lactoylglutathione lyase